MANLSITNTFADTESIDAARFNTNYSDVSTYVNNRNTAAADWEALHCTTSARVPLQIDNSSGSNSIAVFQDNGTNVVTIVDGGNMAVGNVTPDGKLHVHSATAGSVSAAADGDEFIVEGSGNAGMTILSGNSSLGSILFGDDGDNNIGFIQYSHSANSLSVGVNTVTAITIESDQDVHIQPSGTADAELEVSNGASTGGGTVHRATGEAHSSRDIKCDIQYLPNEAELTARKEISDLKPATFRLKKRNKQTGQLEDDMNGRKMKGIIYEDSSEFIKGDGPHKSLVIDYRVLRLEMALKDLLLHG